MAFFRVIYGGSDVSRGDESNPYRARGLNASVPNESTPEQITIATTAGKKVTGTVTVSPLIGGLPHTAWNLSLDGVTWKGWGASLTLTNLDATGKTIWIKAKAFSTDHRGNDDSADLRVTGLVSNA